MKKQLSMLLSCVFAAGSLISFAACSDGADPSADRQGDKFSSPDVTLTVRANKTERTISDELFGVFLEDINYAGYALDDDLVANGSFTYREKSDRWNAAGLSVNVREGEGSLHENNPDYAELDVYEPNAALENAGYEMVPMAAQEGTEYTYTRSPPLSGRKTMKARSPRNSRRRAGRSAASRSTSKRAANG